MRIDTPSEFKNSRDRALAYFQKIRLLATELGEIKKWYVQRTLKMIEAYCYNPKLVEDTARPVLLSLERKKMIQSMQGNVFKTPDRRFSKGDIFLGNVIGNNVPIYLTLRQINEHIGIFGRSGSGKSTLSYNLILQLVHRGIPVRIFDVKDNEYRDLFPHI